MRKASLRQPFGDRRAKHSCVGAIKRELSSRLQDRLDLLARPLLFGRSTSTSTPTLGMHSEPHPIGLDPGPHRWRETVEMILR
ncbi:MAG: hypothetical protein ACI9CV_001026 [Ilumatobacter sp.]|jgi:hypothetical protein